MSSNLSNNGSLSKLFQNNNNNYKNQDVSQDVNEHERTPHVSDLVALFENVALKQGSTNGRDSVLGNRAKANQQSDSDSFKTASEGAEGEKQSEMKENGIETRKEVKIEQAATAQRDIGNIEESSVAKPVKQITVLPEDEQSYNGDDEDNGTDEQDSEECSDDSEEESDEDNDSTRDILDAYLEQDPSYELVFGGIVYDSIVESHLFDHVDVMNGLNDFEAYGPENDELELIDLVRFHHSRMDSPTKGTEAHNELIAVREFLEKRIEANTVENPDYKTQLCRFVLLLMKNAINTIQDPVILSDAMYLGYSSDTMGKVEYWEFEKNFIWNLISLDV